MRYELEDIVKNFPKRVQNSHKGTYGKILNIAGSKFYTGAAILSSLSALKVGAGYVTLACPEEIVPIAATYSPDITFLPLKSQNGCISDDNSDFILEKAEKYDVISIGSGLFQMQETQNFVLKFLAEIDKLCIIDADAINIIAKNNFKNLPKNSVITPHTMELSHLLAISPDEIENDREFYADKSAKEYGCTVVLKGHNTIVSDTENYYVNQSGNSSLSKAGTGDVLTGMIAGLTAQNQNCSMMINASLGVYLHGLAAEIASKELSEYGLLASELISYIPLAVQKIL